MRSILAVTSRRMLLAPMMAVVMVVTLLATSQPVLGDEFETFESLTDDLPVIAGGVTPAVIQQWLNEGWTVEQRITIEDLPDMYVQFRDPDTHEIEWRRGTVPAGTVYYVRSSFPGSYRPPILRPCGNEMRPFRPY